MATRKDLYTWEYYLVYGKNGRTKKNGQTVTVVATSKEEARKKADALLAVTEIGLNLLLKRVRPTTKGQIKDY